MHTPQTIREIGFAKGYNDRLPPEQLPPGYLADALNCFIRTTEIVKRNGYTLIGNDILLNAACQGLKGIRFANGTKELLAVFNGTIYKWTGSGNWTSLGGTLSTTAQVDIVPANNNVYFFDGTNTVPRYNGTAVATVAAIPKGQWARWFHNMMFVTGVSGTTSNVQISNLGDPEDYSTGTATTIGVNPNDGDYITGMNEIKDTLIVAKTQRLWGITGFGTTTLTVSNISETVTNFGSISHRSMVNIGNELLFMSFQGDIPHIRSLMRTRYGTLVDGGIKSNDIETTMNGLNKSSLQTTASLFDGRNVWFAVPNASSTYNNLVIMLDAVTGGWVRHTGINAAVLTSFTIGSTPTIYFGEASASSKAYKFDTSTSDNGTAIAFSITTRRYGGNMPETPKKWISLYCTPKETGNYDITVDYAVDGFTYNNLGTINLSGTGSVFDTIILDTSRLGSTDVHRKRLNIPKAVNYYIQYKMYNTSTTSSIYIRDWETVYFPKHIRKVGT